MNNSIAAVRAWSKLAATEPANSPSISTLVAQQPKQIDGVTIVGAAHPIQWIRSEVGQTGVHKQALLMWGRTSSGKTVFWLQGTTENRILQGVTNQAEAITRSRAVITHSGFTNLQPLSSPPKNPSKTPSGSASQSATLSPSAVKTPNRPAPPQLPRNPGTPPPPGSLPPGGIGPSGPVTGVGSVLLTGFAIGVGAFVGYSLPDWWKQLTEGNTSFNIEGRDSQCGLEETARSYLENLKMDGIDQAIRSIPPQTFHWKTPNGFEVKVKQGWSKDGLTFQVELKGSDGRAQTIGPLKAQITASGTKIPIGTIPFVVAGQNMGELAMALRVGVKGLNEVEFKFTNHSGLVTTLKLKPKACNLDLNFSNLARLNGGSQASAKYWVETHLAEAAKQNRGSIKKGLVDLLMFIQPAPNGIYRNHGSEALSVLTKPLNLLKQAGGNLDRLAVIQARGRNAAPNSSDYRAAKKEAETWLSAELSRATASGRIQPIELRNAYEINFGVSAIPGAVGPVRVVDAKKPAQRSPGIDSLSIRVNWRELQQTAASGGYAIAQLPDARLFITPVSPSVSFPVLLERLSSLLKVKADSLVWAKESNVVHGVNVTGWAVDLRAYSR